MQKNSLTIIVLLFALLQLPAFALGDKLYFEIRENECSFPYPTKLPVYQGDSGEHFDWKRYIEEANSKADQAHRARLARTYFPNNFEGSGESSYDEMVRARFAVEEYRIKCDKLIENYRSRLKRNHPSMLKLFNEWVSLREQALDLEVKFQGSSWDGGSGARVAYPAARAGALISFFRDLSGLASNYLQE